MTRFKEQRRIDNAIEHRNIEELNWALSYCKSRLGISKLKVHVKRWKKQIRDIEEAITDAEHK
ncbi:MAG: hypothetical protein AB2689_24610 [Candidatus Thiodiazotropha taylori]